jgi:hypothetical protein
MMNDVGFGESELVRETGFNSSPVTKGVLIRGEKVGIVNSRRVTMSSEETLSKYQEFFNAAYGPGVLDKKVKHLIALGASLAAGCDL